MSKQQTQHTSSALMALTTAAMMLPNAAQADPPDQTYQLHFSQARYQEAPIPQRKLGLGSDQRYLIDVSHLRFKAPTSSDTEVTLSLLHESMSGASPWFVMPDADGELVQVMSEATISEERTEVGVDFRSYNQRSEVTLSAGHSTENDYTSYSIGFSGAWRLNQDHTSLNFGANSSRDYIDATDAERFNRPTGERLNRSGLSAGVTQVINATNLASINLGINLVEGFLSDPYKLALVGQDTVADSRPDSHEQINIDLSWRRFVKSANAALHLDYRYFTSDWQIDAHTLELTWYQNLGDGWQLTPTLRYHSQSAAAFYRPYYTQTRNDGFYSSDYRLSAFDAYSGQLKLIKRFESLQLDIGYEHYQAEGDHPGMLSYDLLTLGIGYRFQ